MCQILISNVRNYEKIHFKLFAKNNYTYLWPTVWLPSMNIKCIEQNRVISILFLSTDYFMIWGVKDTVSLYCLLIHHVYLWSCIFSKLCYVLHTRNHGDHLCLLFFTLRYQLTPLCEKIYMQRHLGMVSIHQVEENSLAKHIAQYRFLMNFHIIQSWISCLIINQNAWQVNMQPFLYQCIYNRFFNTWAF